MQKIIFLMALLVSSFAQASLVQTLDKTYVNLEGKNLDSTCDSEYYRGIKYQIAADLDQRAKDIVLANSGNQITEQVLPDGWRSFTRRWSKFYYDYFQAKEKPSSDPAWYHVLKEFQGLLADDQDRIMSWKNPDLGHDLGPFITKLQEMMQDCVAGGDCSDARLSESERFRVNRMEFYGHYTRKIFHGPIENKIPEAKKFLQRLAVDADYYQSRNMGFAVDLNEKTLLIPIRAPDFSAEELSRFERLTARKWSTDGIKIQLQFVDRATPGMFEIRLGPKGGRPFVAIDQRQMVLPPGSSDQTISHEFGHVLGLPDEYYTRWNRWECEYIYEYDNSNIMSNHHAGGVVLRHHIESLRKIYFGREQ